MLRAKLALDTAPRAAAALVPLRLEAVRVVELAQQADRAAFGDSRVSLAQLGRGRERPLQPARDLVGAVGQIDTVTVASTL